MQGVRAPSSPLALWPSAALTPPQAVALGDLSQKITVPVQGAVMVQLKDVINTMVDKLGQFAKEVTRVSQEVGSEGYARATHPAAC